MRRRLRFHGCTLHWLALHFGAQSSDLVDRALAVLKELSQGPLAGIDPEPLENVGAHGEGPFVDDQL